MDARLRQLERDVSSGDPDAHKQLQRLRCRSAGHVAKKIQEAYWQIDADYCGQIIYVQLQNGKNQSLKITDRMISQDLVSAKAMFTAFCKTLAECARCGISIGDGCDYRHIFEQRLGHCNETV